jgi:hypothetical protein
VPVTLTGRTGARFGWPAEFESEQATTTTTTTTVTTTTTMTSGDAATTTTPTARLDGSRFLLRHLFDKKNETKKKLDGQKRPKPV